MARSECNVTSRHGSTGSTKQTTNGALASERGRKVTRWGEESAQSGRTAVLALMQMILMFEGMTHSPLFLQSGVFATSEPIWTSP